MSIHYYLGWFNDNFPVNLVKHIQNDLRERRSLVMITACKYPDDGEVIGETERGWFDHVGIKFDSYHIIDFETSKELAKDQIKDASAVLLLGGSVIEQNELLMKLDLSQEVRESKIVMGTSAGAINMSSKWLYSKYTDNESGNVSLHNGIGLNEFSVLSHFDLENNMDQLQSELEPLLKSVDVYASNKDCAVRVKENKIDILGTVYLVTEAKIEKLNETLL